jgi:hypothetical protein
MPTPGRRDGWRKSSYSDTGNGCVEIANTLSAMRDSKNPEGSVLSVDVRGLVARAKVETFGA